MKDSDVSASVRLTSPRVLLVDDVEENLDLLVDILPEYGYEAIRARTGWEVLEILQREEINIVVADAMMPSLDGFQLCKEIRKLKDHAHLPFIIYTANYLDEENEEFARSIGVDAYVSKTGGIEPLVSALNTLSKNLDCSGIVGQSDLEERGIGRPHPVDEQKFLERHHAIIVKKLEEQMEELKNKTVILARQNRELQASEARYRQLFENANVGIFVLERESGRVLDVNAEGVVLLNLQREEILSSASLTFEDEAGSIVEKLRSADTFAMETSIKQNGGDVRIVEIAAGPISYNDNTKVLLCTVDVTEQQRMREELLQSEKMNLMGRLAAGIAHDIRNPLAAISLNLQFLQKQLPADPRLRGPLDFAIEGTHRIGKVIDNTLNLARVTPPDVKTEQVNAIVSDAIEFIKSSLDQKQLTIDVHLGEALPTIRVEAKQIGQVMLNLLQNAVDASPDHGTITVSTGIIDDAGGGRHGRVIISVADRGSGIPPEQLKRLFEPFQTTKHGGTGLGLALSKQIMDKHGADIRIEQFVGGGTIARLIFPISS